METSLHRALKERYGPSSGGSCEVTLRGFRIDAVGPCGRLVEIQSGALGPLRLKLVKLLPEHRVRVVKPVVVERRVVRRACVDGPDLSARRSPKRSAVIDVFEDLVGLARIFPHPNLEIEVLGVSIDEVRTPRRRWPGYKVADRCLSAIGERILLEAAPDLWRLFPDGHDWTEPFTTIDLAARTGRPVSFAQRAAYCLRLSGAARPIGKTGNRLIYVGNQGSPGRTREPEWHTAEARGYERPGMPAGYPVRA
jgi:hypothetical protein